jgi:hypothetical protein
MNGNYPPQVPLGKRGTIYDRQPSLLTREFVHSFTGRRGLSEQPGTISFIIPQNVPLQIPNRRTTPCTPVG